LKGKREETYVTFSIKRVNKQQKKKHLRIFEINFLLQRNSAHRFLKTNAACCGYQIGD
jgi:hypothetical protein